MTRTLDSQGLEMANRLFAFIETDTLCLMACDAMAQELAATPTEALVYSRAQLEQALAKVLDRAQARALKRFAEAEKPEAISQAREEMAAFAEAWRAAE